MPMTTAQRSQTGHLVSRIAAVFLWSAGLLALAGIAWSGVETRAALRQATQRAVRVSELRGSLAHLNEWLTMSARLAAATGDEQWIVRYEEAGPKLAATIGEALSIATPDVAAALLSTTTEAQNGLVDMQRAAFRLVKAGDRDIAMALLDGAEYTYLEAVYQSGIDAFGADLTAFAAASTNNLDRRAWLEALGLALGLMFLIAFVLGRRGRSRLTVALAETEIVARTDPLTGLPNRRKLFEDVKALASGSAAFAFLMLDLDRFKAVNDAHGHVAGDELLQAVATRLRSIARANDVVARLGGDEFAIIAPLAPTALRSEADSAYELATRLCAGLAAPFALRTGHEIDIGASIGVALHEPAAGSADDLVYRADVALYRAKADGRNRICFFNPLIEERARERARLEADLRRAIQDGVLVPYFQPLVELETGRLVSFEMLARWPTLEGRMVSPGEFIPLAERTGMIGPLTDHLMRTACQAAVTWPSHLTLACNLSPLLLRDGSFVAALRTMLAETGFDANRLELEITESALLENQALARDLCRELKELGVSLALDDFGTGYSSLRHLQSLPFDKLKIDAGFVGAMMNDAESRKIVAAVVGLGRSLGLVTVAEGVETEDAADLLRELGCDLGQGWLLGRPAPADVTAKLLERVASASALVPDAAVVH